MKFNEILNLVERKMSNFINVPRLIAEVQKRPAIWDGRPKARQFLPRLWMAVSTNIGADVNQCKRKWKNLRDTYHAELRRYLRRLQSAKLTGISEPPKSKWIYYSDLAFLTEGKQLNDSPSVANETTNSISNDHHDADDTYNSCSTPELDFHSIANVKLEPGLESNNIFNEVENDDTDNDLLFDEFQSVATPRAGTKSSEAFPENNIEEKNLNLRQLNAMTSTTATTPKCKCFQSVDEQVHFLQDLGREGQNLMKSARQDITSCNKLNHIGDFDYNFLISFLPQIKKMSELQNLRFRSKMSELVLNILTETQDTPKT